MKYKEVRTRGNNIACVCVDNYRSLNDTHDIRHRTSPTILHYNLTKEYKSGRE